MTLTSLSRHLAGALFFLAALAQPAGATVNEGAVLSKPIPFGNGGGGPDRHPEHRRHGVPASRRLQGRRACRHQRLQCRLPQ
ncbi:MAG: hypothetical protein WDN06_02760 [Asticcacaulis sp.]